MNQYQVSFVEAIKMAFSKYCVFTGRASRSEFWWFSLFLIIVSCLLSGPSIGNSFALITAAAHGEDVTALAAAGNPVLSTISYLWSLFVLLPQLGLYFRRLHDAGHSGWNILWLLLPVVGWIVVLVFLCQASQPHANRYGNVPNLR